MSLLEDIFLGDEANEAQELERVIEGDEFDERRRSRSRSPDSNSDSEKEDEAQEDKRRVDPTVSKPKKVVKNPRQVLNPARLTGPRGISIIPDHFKQFQFKGKGHEKEDLDLVLKKLEHWAYRLYPKFEFEDCLKKIETLGKKQAVSVHLRKIRSDQLTTDEPVVQKDSSDDETQPEEQDEFDKLLQQQIDLARATPAPNSVKKGFMTPGHQNFSAPKATSSPSINDEQRERMLRNRQFAEERRLARLKISPNNSFDDNAVDVNNKTPIIEIDTAVQETRVGSATGNVDLTKADETRPVRKHNKSNVINSSDEDDDGMIVNKSITVDIHLETTKGRGGMVNKDEIIENERETNTGTAHNSGEINVEDKSDIKNDRDKSVDSVETENVIETQQSIISENNENKTVDINTTSKDDIISKEASAKDIINPSKSDLNTNLPHTDQMDVDFDDEFEINQ